MFGFRQPLLVPEGRAGSYSPLLRCPSVDGFANTASLACRWCYGRSEEARAEFHSDLHAKENRENVQRRCDGFVHTSLLLLSCPRM